MPTYQVIKKAFHNGRIYDPNGKRRVVVTTRPYTEDDGINPKPSWVGAVVEPVADEPSANDVLLAAQQAEELEASQSLAQRESEELEATAVESVDFSVPNSEASEVASPDSGITETIG